MHSLLYMFIQIGQAFFVMFEKYEYFLSKIMKNVVGKSLMEVLFCAFLTRKDAVSEEVCM